MKISVCLDAVCPQVEPAQAVRQLAAIGVSAVEFWGWENKNLEALAAACTQQGVQVAGMCTSSFLLNVPAERPHYLEGLVQSLQAAKRLGCPTLITQVGMDTGEARTAQHESIAQGLRAAAPLLQEAGVTLVIEPLNLRVNHPGYYLSSSQEAFDLVQEADSPFVKVLFDVYHQQITEGDLLAHLLPNLELVGHLHAAGVPGRHELETGEVHYPRLLQEIKRAGYQGFAGLEYTPVQPYLQAVKQDLDALKAYDVF